MSAFGKVLGATFAVVLVSKVGLTVAFHADARHAEQAQQIVNRINNDTSELAAQYSGMFAEKEADKSDIVLNYTLKPDFVENMKQMADAEVRKNALNAYGRDSLSELVNEGMTVVVKFRNETGQMVKNVTFSQENQG